MRISCHKRPCVVIDVFGLVLRVFFHGCGFLFVFIKDRLFMLLVATGIMLDFGWKCKAYLQSKMVDFHNWFIFVKPIAKGGSND